MQSLSVDIHFCTSKNQHFYFGIPICFFRHIIIKPFYVLEQDASEILCVGTVMLSVKSNPGFQYT